jgi:transposase InsO family protein
MRQLYIGRWLKGINTFFKFGWKYNLSPEAQYRLKVIGWHEHHGKNISKTGRHFDIHRNTVSAWLNLFDPNDLSKLEPKAPIPIRTYRKKTPEWIVQRVIAFKKAKPYYGKEKVSYILKRDEGIEVSPSTCGRIFKKYKLTYLWRTHESPVNYKKTVRKRKSRKRPPKQRNVTRPGQWIQIDTVVIYHKGQKVWVISAVDLYTRLAVSFAYRSPSSKNAKDFLEKLELFFPGLGKIEMIQSDNGSEFLKFFDQACEKKKIKHTFSYPKTPKMNCYIERYNRTIQEECLKRTDAFASLYDLNTKIIAYITEYNAYRPHQSLDYQTPLQVYCNHSTTSIDSTPVVHKKIWTHIRTYIFLLRRMFFAIMSLSMAL